jgi:xylan 1,4-beta-xylosidase
MLDRRTFLQNTMLAAATAAYPALAQSERTVPVSIDTRQVTGPLTHIWEECAGSDRAAITLRESWRTDLDRWRAEVGLKRVRFHGIFNDELGVYAPSITARTRGEPNFQNVDRVYDGLVSRGAAPFIELSFMPKWLASADLKYGFYNWNASQPASLDDWAGFIKSFVVHLVDRYGLAVVRAWPFEVWNEPNLPFFWSGNQQQYFDLYKATAVAIKSVDPQLQVGGPATAATGWIADFAAYCQQSNAPVDFFSTHIYAGDKQEPLFGPTVRYPQSDVIPEAVRRAREKIDAGAFRGRPLWLTEWSSDSPAMIAHIIKGCLPYCQAMSQWALSSTFEELGVANYLLKEGYMGWGMLVQGIATPSFNTYKLLHALGLECLATEGPALAARRADGSAAALIWNLADVQQPSGLPDSSHTRTVSGDSKRFQIRFAAARPGQRVQVRYVDQERGSPMPAWREMGSPKYITLEQMQLLRRRAEIPPPTLLKLDAASQVTLDLPPEGVALIELMA